MKLSIRDVNRDPPTDAWQRSVSGPSAGSRSSQSSLSGPKTPGVLNIHRAAGASLPVAGMQKTIKTETRASRPRPGDELALFLFLSK